MPGRPNVCEPTSAVTGLCYDFVRRNRGVASSLCRAVEVIRGDVEADSRILIVKASSMGDIVLALPMLRTLRHRYPRAYIAWIVESPFQELLHGNRDLDRLFVVETATVARTVTSLGRAVRQIRAEAFDVVVDLQGWIKSQLLCMFSGARSMTGLMKKNELGFHILTRGVPYRPHAHVVDLLLDVARLLGADEPQMSFDVPVFEPDRRYIDAFLASLPLESSTDVAVLKPGTTWKNKRWSLRRLAEVGRELAASGRFFPVVSWGPGEEPDAATVVRLMGARAALAPPTTIRQLAALFERSRLYVGTDSGPMHLASALGVPTVALFGPSDPARFAPYRSPSRVVRHALPCSPCGVPTCRFKTVECMSAIDVPEVLEAVRGVTSPVATGGAHAPASG